jgi:2Fe-2S ferredoxin
MSVSMKYAVDILPAGLTLMVSEDEPLMSAAQANGWTWPNVCGGQASCGVCLLYIQRGFENASSIGRDEAVRLSLIRGTDKPGARLACQLRIVGPLVVFKRGARLIAASVERPTNEEGAGTR